MTAVDPQTATLTEVVEKTLKSLRGGHHHLAPLTETVLAEKLVEALTPLLAVQRAAVLREGADAIDAETRQLKAHDILEPDKFRPCRGASAQLRRMADAKPQAEGV